MSDELKHKILNYEADPPPASWDIIASELKESNAFLLLSQKMYGVEVVPPATAWQNISNALQTETEARLIPLKKGNTRLFKFAFAAAAIGVIFLGSLFLFNNFRSSKQFIASDPKEEKDTPGQQPAQPVQKVPLPAPAPVTSSQLLASVTAPVLNLHRSHSRKKNKILRNAVVNPGRKPGESAITVPARPIRDESGDRIYDPLLLNGEDDKYVDITGPNGEQTRISSKFVNALLYMNDDSRTEEYEGFFNKSFVESIIWTTRFQEWRDKILKTSFVPSSTNFLDILEFKDLILKDKEKE